MKHYFLLTLILSASFHAYGDETTSIRLNHESNNADSASGIAILFDIGKPKTFLVSLGFSANSISSDESLAHAGRNNIYPVYGFVKFASTYRISPFFEFGIDLGDVLIEDFEEFINHHEEEDNDSAIDTYLSLGLTLKINKKMTASLYRKMYNINFSEVGFSTINEVDLYMTGASLSYYLD